MEKKKLDLLGAYIESGISLILSINNINSVSREERYKFI